MHESFKPAALTAMLPVWLLAAMATPSWAMQFDTDVPDLKVRWDNTVGYSIGFRTQSPSSTLTQGPATLSYNDGDLNFSKRSRPITNRLDWFSEADVSYRGSGARISAAAWYDAAYSGGTSNPSGLAPSGFAAPFSQSTTLNGGQQGQFPDATRQLHGRKAEVLDAFVFGQFDVGTVPVNARLGRHALTWGETVFFGANGIAGGMAPVDITKLLSSPNATFKEIIRPVNQLSAQAQISPAVSVAAYYQLQWEKNVLPGVGSFYSNGDAFDAGGERILLANFVSPTPFIASSPRTGTAIVQRAADEMGPDSGQGGISAHLRLPGSDVDFGFYAIQYHAKMPMAYVSTSLSGSTYKLVYPEKIRAYGVSANTTVLDDINLGSEVSLRTNAPLARGLIFLPGAGFDANSNPAYPVGRTLHVNVSTIMAVPSYFLARESNLVAEIAWNRVLGCTKMCENIPSSVPGVPGFTARDQNATRNAYGLGLTYTPVYRQVFQGVDLSVPMGITYSPEGKSEAVVPLFTHHGGTMNLGLSASVREAYTVALTFTHFYGPAALALDSSGSFTAGQTLKDRDNVTLSARFSF